MKTAMTMKLSGFAAVALAAGFIVTSAPDARAAGCNGVVNPAVWGCAPWDNNNGPKFPNYKRAGSSVQTPSNGGNVAPGVQQNGAGIISRDGAGIISNDGASMCR